MVVICKVSSLSPASVLRVPYVMTCSTVCRVCASGSSYSGGGLYAGIVGYSAVSTSSMSLTNVTATHNTAGRALSPAQSAVCVDTV